MFNYTLDMIYFHQRNILHLLLSCDLKDIIEYFSLQSKFLMLACNHCKFFNKTSRVASYLFPYYSQVLPNQKIWGSVRVSDSISPMRDSLENSLNEIPFVNSLPLFLPTINLEFQILNYHCALNSQQDNIITFILTCNSNAFLSQITYSLPQSAWTFPSLTHKN